jgi:hypothetical protein
VVCGALAAATGARADGRADVPRDLSVPSGTKADASGQLVSSEGLRDATEFFAHQLERKKVAARQVGPTKVRGVEVTRFVSQDTGTSWLAIHVWRISGKTLISFVPRANP